MRALLAFSALVLAGCPTPIDVDDDAGPGGGPVIISCEEATDCPQDVPECAFGVCKRPCVANDGCIDPQTFCNSTVGYCELGCRDSSTCTGGTVCSAGACIVSQGCATKCDCAAGQVCTAGACTEPPGECNGPDDCGRGLAADDCNDFACNGFTHLCFDPDPEPCNGDGDCVGRPGCAGGCVCTGNQQCVPGVQCTAQNEAQQCGAGNYCDGNGSCQPLPACTGDGQCAPLGLQCNVGAGQCQRTTPCGTSADCTQAPQTFCAGNGFCAQPSCLNGGDTCVGDEVCAADGRCVLQGPGGPCTVNANCDANQYCAFVNGTGECTIGCRDNASCAPGELCDGTHTCVNGGGGGLGQFGDSCTDDSECQSPMICGVFTGTCAEQCPTPGASCAGGACCSLSGQQCCNSFGFCGGFTCAAP